MRAFKHTNITLREVGDMLRKGLQDELKAQKHNATGRLSRGLKYNVIKKGMSILNVTSSVAYWKAVNNPKFAKKPNLTAIQSWVRAKKGIEPTSAAITRIYAKMLRQGYGKPYVHWTEGNNLRRTNFAGYVANKFKSKVAGRLAPSIGEDVASMIREKIKNNTKAKVS